jgi:hypothetical protein
MIFAGATRSANVGVSAPLRTIPGKLVIQVPPGASSARWRRICFPDQLPDKDILDFVGQRYFKEDVGAASPVDSCHFRENLVQDRSSFIATLQNLTIRLARVSKDYAPDQRSAKRPDEFELAIVTADLLETASNPCYARLRVRPSLFGKSGSYQGIGCCKLSACLAWGD